MPNPLNQTKLMLLMRDQLALCDKYAPANPTEADAMVGLFLSTAATIAAKMHKLPFSPPQIERLARAAQDGLNEAIFGEKG